MSKQKLAAAAFITLAIFNAAQTTPTVSNYAAALVFLTLAVVALVAASRDHAS